MRRLLLVALVAGVLVGGGGLARAAERPRVVLVFADGTSVDDWTTQPHLSRLLDEASVGLISTATAEPGNELRAYRASAAATLGAGERRPSPGEPPYERTALGRALDDAGIDALVLGDADVPLTGERDRAAAAVIGGDVAHGAPTIGEPTFPGRGVVDAEAVALAVTAATAGLIVVDPGDMARVQYVGEEPPIVRAAQGRSLAALDALVGSLSQRIGSDDVLIVLALTPAIEPRLQGVRLAPVAIDGPGFDAGLLSSPTTRTRGVVTLADLTVTIADLLGLTLPARTEGRAVRVHPDPGAGSDLVALSRDLTHAARSRAVALPVMRYGGLAAVLAAVVLVLTGRGRRRVRTAMPRGARATAATGLLVAAATPAAIVLEAAVPTRTTVPAALVVCAIAVVAAVAGRARLGAVRALGWIAGATVGLIAIDLILGQPLMVRSSLGSQVAFGGRFFGVDEGVLGIVIGATFIWAGTWLDGARDLRRAQTAVLAAVTVIIFLLSAPAFGSKFGAALTAVPAAGVFALRSGGVRIGFRHVAIIGAVTVAIAGTLALNDRLAPVQEQSHVARALGGDTDVAGLIGRKMRASWDLATGTSWGAVALGFAVGLIAIARVRRDALDRAMWGRPHLRAAVWACATAAIVGMVANDGGVLVAATVLAQAATGVMIVFMEG